MQHFFYYAAVLPSMKYGLIPKNHLTVSGDSTTLHTHAYPGWPPGTTPPGLGQRLGKYYFEYMLFQLSCYNDALRIDVSLLLNFTSAKRHDSISFLVAFHGLEKHMPAVSA